MKPVMPWIDLLSGVAATDFQARRDHVADLIAQAGRPSCRAAHLLAEAYIEGFRLEAAAREHWSIREIEYAQNSAFVGGDKTTWLI